MDTQMPVSHPPPPPSLSAWKGIGGPSKAAGKWAWVLLGFRSPPPSPQGAPPHLSPFCQALPYVLPAPQLVLPTFLSFRMFHLAVCSHGAVVLTVGWTLEPSGEAFLCPDGGTPTQMTTSGSLREGLASVF